MGAVMTTTVHLYCDADGCDAVDVVKADAPEVPMPPVGWIELHKSTATGIVTSVLCPAHEVRD